MLWLELLIESGVMPAERLSALYEEAQELTALFTTSQQDQTLGF
jgi:hypothetical protein